MSNTLWRQGVENQLSIKLENQSKFEELSNKLDVCNIIIVVNLPYHISCQVIMSHCCNNNIELLLKIAVKQIITFLRK